jgi:hypothetical protein
MDVRGHGSWLLEEGVGMKAADVEPGCGCGSACGQQTTPVGGTLPVVWQRLLVAGETCPRCSDTQASVEAAVATLTEVLRPLHLTPTLRTVALDLGTFEQDPAESNRIWIAGRPIEEWLGARVASSACCAVCGDQPCRTVELGEGTYEAIPEALVVRAGLVAAASLIGS